MLFGIWSGEGIVTSMGVASTGQEAHGVWALLLSDPARPLRFAFTGGMAGLSQLSLLLLLTRHGWNPTLANSTAFLLAAQLNFSLSYLFTWHNRAVTRGLWRSWTLFHGSIACMALVNMVVFMLARVVLPTLVASAVGIGVAACGNFILGDRVVFRPPVLAVSVVVGVDQPDPAA